MAKIEDKKIVDKFSKRGSPNEIPTTNFVSTGIKETALSLLNIMQMHNDAAKKEITNEIINTPSELLMKEIAKKKLKEQKKIELLELVKKDKVGNKKVKKKSTLI